MKNSNAIVLAMFGTSVETALPGLFNIRNRMVEYFPATPVRMAFTSQIIRRIWHQRALDQAYRAAHPAVPAEIYAIIDPLSAVSRFREEGCTAVLVQPLYMAPAEEYRDLLAALAPLQSAAGRGTGQGASLRVAVGRPVLGGAAGTRFSRRDDIAAAAAALADDAAYAHNQNAALLYMGHGSKNMTLGDLYSSFAEEMRRQFPQVVTITAMVEGVPSIDNAIAALKEQEAAKVVLKPLMIVAGDHARKDMIGTGPRGWQRRLAENGLDVAVVLNGLGEQDAFARIFVRHAAEAARDAGIELQ